MLPLHPQRGSISIPIGIFGMHSLDGQQFSSSRSPGFEHPLPPTGGHSRPESVDASAVAALGLIGSFGHRCIKPLFLIFLVEQKLYLDAS